MPRSFRPFATSVLTVGVLAAATLGPGARAQTAQGSPQAPPAAPAQNPAAPAGERGGRGAQAPGGAGAGQGAGAQGRGGAAAAGRGAPGGRGAAAAAPTRKHVLILGNTAGYHHGSTSDAMVALAVLGRQSNVFDTEIRTDTEWVTKGSMGNGDRHNLDYYDAIVAVNTTGTWKLDEQQKKDFLAAIHDDGKGFVGVHGALDANHTDGERWDAYFDMIGGVFTAHPWGVFDAPVIVEDQDFPATRHFPKMLRIRDEMFQAGDPWSRSQVHVLMRLDESKLTYENTQAPVRPDHDLAIAWSKMYGKGRVFYSSLGHGDDSWEDPDVLKMYLEAIKWVLGRTEGSTEPHARN